MVHYKVFIIVLLEFIGRCLPGISGADPGINSYTELCAVVKYACFFLCWYQFYELRGVAFIAVPDLRFLFLDCSGSFFREIHYLPLVLRILYVWDFLFEQRELYFPGEYLLMEHPLFMRFCSSSFITEYMNS